MKRWWLVVLLLLSVGLNLGLLAQRARAEKKARAAQAAEERAAEARAEAAEAAAAAEPATAPAVPAAPNGEAQPREAQPPEPQPREPQLLENPPRNPRPPREKPPFLVKLMNRMANEVGVEGEQRQKFLAIQQGFFERTFETREELRRRQQALRQNLVSPQPDRTLASRQVEELSQAQKELEQAFLDNYFETTAILDQDQQKRYRRLILELRKMRWDRGAREEAGPQGGPPEGLPPGEGPRQQRRRERWEAREREREARDGELRERPPRPPGGG